VCARVRAVTVRGGRVLRVVAGRLDQVHVQLVDLLPCRTLEPLAAENDFALKPSRHCEPVFQKTTIRGFEQETTKRKRAKSFEVQAGLYEPQKATGSGPEEREGMGACHDVVDDGAELLVDVNRRLRAQVHQPAAHARVQVGVRLRVRVQVGVRLRVCVHFFDAISTVVSESFSRTSRG
jgi:hypothetical protein